MKNLSLVLAALFVIIIGASANAQCNSRAFISGNNFAVQSLVVPQSSAFFSGGNVAFISQPQLFSNQFVSNRFVSNRFVAQPFISNRFVANRFVAQPFISNRFAVQQNVRRVRVRRSFITPRIVAPRVINVGRSRLFITL